MKQYQGRNVKIKLSEVVLALTHTDSCNEESRILILNKNIYKTEFTERYVVCEVSHCSCYDFDEATYDFTEFTGFSAKEDLLVFLKSPDYTGLRFKAYNILFKNFYC